MTVNSNSPWLPRTPESPTDVEAEPEQEAEQRATPPPGGHEKRLAKPPAPPPSQLPFLTDRSGAEISHVRSLRKLSCGRPWREDSSSVNIGSDCSGSPYERRQSCEETPEFSEELRHELQAINRKLDDLFRHLKAKKRIRCCGGDSGEPDIPFGKTFTSGTGGFGTGSWTKVARRASSNSSSRESMSLGRGSMSLGKAQARFETPVVKALYRKRSMDMPMTSGLEMVLSQTPPIACPEPETGTHSQRFSMFKLTGRSKTVPFDRAPSLAENEPEAAPAPASDDNGDETKDGDGEGPGSGTMESSLDTLAASDQRSSDKKRHGLGDYEVQRVSAMLAGRTGFSFRHIIWNIMENPEATSGGRCFAKFNACFVMLTTLVTVIQAIDGSPLTGVPAAVLETAIDVAFLLELIVRIVCCPSPWAIWLLSMYNWIDILAAAPLIVRASIGWVLPEGEVQSVPHGILLCAVPILRLLKILRRFEKLHLLIRAFHLAAEAMPVLLFILTIIAMVFSVLIYLVEPRDNIQSLAKSFWLCLVTMTTVGYGDTTPKTGAGHIIIGVLVIVTVLYMAIPLGIIGSAFTDTWQDRDRILLMQRTRDRLCQWGYTAHDIPALFSITDSDQDGELNLKEFKKLLNQMQVGLSEERIVKLFKSFDVDDSGTVDDEEFVKGLFPEAYHAIYYDPDVLDD